jgi:serine/threonine-protein kinase HipA
MYTDSELREVFGKPIEPKIRLNLSEVMLVAQKSVGKLSISGVQPKLSVSLEGDELVAAPAGGRFILKPQNATFAQLPENEYLCMKMAAQCEIETARSILLPLSDGSWAYVVRRFDRTGTGEKLPCEDMTQILGKTKYEGSYEQIGKAIRQYCDFANVELQRLFERVLYCFVIGNGDAHLKNFSLLTTESTVALSPAYDLVSSRIVIPNEDDELALMLAGRRKNFSRRAFLEFASTLGVPSDIAEKKISAYANRAWMAKQIEESHLAPDLKQTLQQTIHDRLDSLGVVLAGTDK